MVNVQKKLIIKKVKRYKRELEDKKISDKTVVRNI